MLIAVDVDGVVCDLHTAWLGLYNTDYADSLTPADITTWDMHPHVKPECGRQIYEYLRHPDLYTNAPVVPGALAGVQALRDDGHRVVFATSCVLGGMWDRKLEWLIRQGFIDGSHRVYADYVALTDKALLRADVLVDDYVKNVRSFPNIALLFDQPWNASESWGLRTLDWEGVVRYVGYI